MILSESYMSVARTVFMTWRVMVVEYCIHMDCRSILAIRVTFVETIKINGYFFGNN